MRKALALSLAVLLLAAPAAVARGKDRDAEEAYEAARRAYYALKADPQRRKLRHNWLNVAQKFDAVALKYPNSDRAPDAIFTAAELIKDLSRISMLEEDLRAAIAHYEKLLEKYPKDNLSDDGALALALIHTERTGDTERARGVLDLALKRLPKGDVHNKLVALAATLPAQPARRAEGKRIAARKSSKTDAPAAGTSTSTPATSASETSAAARAASSAPPTRTASTSSSEGAPAGASTASAPAAAATASASASASPSAAVAVAPSAAASGSTGAASTGRSTASPPAPTQERSALADAFARVGRPPEPTISESEGPQGLSAASDVRKDAAVPGAAASTASKKDDGATSAATATATATATAAPTGANKSAEAGASASAQGSGSGSSADPAPAAVAKVDALEARARLRRAVRGGGEEITLAEQLGLKVRRVVIDAGHGGHDSGAIGKRGTREKDVTLAISRRVGEILADRGLEVVLTRDDDTYVRLEDRTRIANEAKGDLFISIHCNAAENRKVRGTETFTLNVAADRYSIRLAARENASSEKSISDLQFILADLATKANTEESDRLAQRVQSSLVSSLSQKYRGVQDLGTKHALFYVLLGAKMPAILVETAFLSHPQEEKWLASRAFQESTARAIADGVQAFLEDREKLARADARIE